MIDPSRRTYLIALKRGLEVVGSESQLARLLDITIPTLRAYLTGAVDVPIPVFLQVVDLLYPTGSRHPHPAPAPSEPRLNRRETLASASAPVTQAPRGTSSLPLLAHPFFAPDFQPQDRHELLAAALDAAMGVAGANFGNIQLVDPFGVLRIEAQDGFSAPFLKFFHQVYGTESACGAAHKEHRQVFVGDVESDPIFAGNESGQVVLDAGVRAVTSSPVVNDRGNVVGMLSTHHRDPQEAGAVNLIAQQLVSQRLARFLATTG